MILSNTTLTKIRNFASLGYSPERICLLLDLSLDESRVVAEMIRTPGTDAHHYYLKGQALGDYNKDVELTKMAERGDVDAITLLGQRREDREIADLKRELFDV